MVFKHFRLQIILRIILLCASIFIFSFLIFKSGLPATTFIVAVFILYQIISLINYVEKTNQYLTRFLEAVRYSDFSQSFNLKGMGKSFDELNQAFSEVIEDFRKTRAEKEENFRYLQTVVQHVGIGLIAFRLDGTVEFFNPAAKKLLRMNQLHNIEKLKSRSNSLVKALEKLRSGQKTLVQLQDGDELLQLIIHAREFKLQYRTIKLISIQNIQSELEEKEFEAWQKLIRVLTHEIMNSITPISSLAATMNDLLADCTMDDALQVSNETIADIHGAAQTIQKRSEGLLHFVEEYRRLTRLPKPNFQFFPIKKMFLEIEQLMAGQLKDSNIQFSVRIDPENLELTADPDLVEQVIINLLKNALQALHDQSEGMIRMNARLDERGRVIIQVIDNGPGIIDEVKDKIFVPFFTTKKEGSGIGLSLSRQIMRLHGGTISVHSHPKSRTVFTLRF